MSEDEIHHKAVRGLRELSDQSSAKVNLSEDEGFKRTNSSSTGRTKRRRVSDDVSESDADTNFVPGKQFNLEDDSDDSIHGMRFDVKKFEDDILGDDDAVFVSDSDHYSVEREAFNLEEERRTGVFDQNGNYLEVEKDEEEQEDQWLDDYKDPEVHKKTQLAQEKRANQQGLHASTKSYAYTLEDIVCRLVYFMPIDKDVLNALAILNKQRKKLRKEKEKAAQKGLDEESKTIGRHLKYISHGIDRITTLVSALQQKGIQNGYQLDRPAIEKLIEEEGIMSNQSDSYQAKIWAFKWLNDTKTDTEYFTSYEMQYWKENYFEGKVIVKYKEDPDEDSNWVHVDCLTFM
ncbi:FAFR655Cp [Eremothecium gossypii FDAG1]|nr:FAFR655Cp [Eremothecium gossypii FDAG1]